MELYRTKEIIPIFKRRKRSRSKGSDAFPGSLLDSEATILNRLVLLAEKGLVKPVRVDGRGHGSIRLYDRDAIVEMAIAFEVMGYGISTETVRLMLQGYRSARKKGDDQGWVVFFRMGTSEGGIFVRDFVQIPQEMKRMAVGFSLEEVTSLLVVNVGKWETRIDQFLGD